MLYELILIMLLATIPACFSYLVDYALGFPGGDEINDRAILFGWSYKLARRALINSGKYQEVMNNLEAFGSADNETITKTIFIEGRKFFRWEQVVGMCIFCTNFYVSLIASIVMFFTINFYHLDSLLLFVLIPVFSHSILRKI